MYRSKISALGTSSLEVDSEDQGSNYEGDWTVRFICCGVVLRRQSEGRMTVSS